MSYHFYYCILLANFFLFEEYRFNNAQRSEKNDGGSGTIVIRIDNQEFVLHGMKKTWWDAAATCKQNGMTIGEVKTINEARKLCQKMLKSRPVAIENAWIGGYKSSLRNQDTNWRWQSTGEKIKNDSDLWLRSSGKLTESGLGLTSSDQQCLLLDWHLHSKTSANYVMTPCNRKREFICQRNIQSTVKNTKSIISRSNSSVRSSVAKVGTANDRPSVMSEPVPSTTLTSKINSPLMMNTKIKRKKKKVKDSTTPPPITITAATEDEYSDYKMWELGKVQMKLWEKKNAKSKRKKLKSSTIYHKSTSLKKEPVTTSSYGSVSTRLSRITPSTTEKPFEPLKLYYAFEGPMVGGLTATPMPQEQFHSEAHNISARRYHKYMKGLRYNQNTVKKLNRRY